MTYYGSSANDAVQIDRRCLMTGLVMSGLATITGCGPAATITVPVITASMFYLSKQLAVNIISNAAYDGLKSLFENNNNVSSSLKENMGINSVSDIKSDDALWSAAEENNPVRIKIVNDGNVRVDIESLYFSFFDDGSNRSNNRVRVGEIYLDAQSYLERNYTIKAERLSNAVKRGPQKIKVEVEGRNVQNLKFESSISNRILIIDRTLT